MLPLAKFIKEYLAGCQETRSREGLGLESAETPCLLAASEGWPRSTLGGDEFDPVGIGRLARWYSLIHRSFIKHTFPLAQSWPLV